MNTWGGALKAAEGAATVGCDFLVGNPQLTGPLAAQVKSACAMLGAYKSLKKLAPKPQRAAAPKRAPPQRAAPRKKRRR